MIDDALKRRSRELEQQHLPANRQDTGANTDGLEQLKRPRSGGDTVAIGIGQSYWTATPLQMAQTTSVLVNRGRNLIPKLLRGHGQSGELVSIPLEEKQPVILKQVA